MPAALRQAAPAPPCRAPRAPAAAGAAPGRGGQSRRRHRRCTTGSGRAQPVRLFGGSGQRGADRRHRVLPAVTADRRWSAGTPARRGRTASASPCGPSSAAPSGAWSVPRRAAPARRTARRAARPRGGDPARAARSIRRDRDMVAAREQAEHHRVARLRRRATTTPAPRRAQTADHRADEAAVAVLADQHMHARLPPAISGSRPRLSHSIGITAGVRARTRRSGPTMSKGCGMFGALDCHRVVRSAKERYEPSMCASSPWAAGCRSRRFSIDGNTWAPSPHGQRQGFRARGTRKLVR